MLKKQKKEWGTERLSLYILFFRIDLWFQFLQLLVYPTNVQHFTKLETDDK